MEEKTFDWPQSVPKALILHTFEDFDKAMSLGGIFYMVMVRLLRFPRQSFLNCGV